MNGLTLESRALLRMTERALQAEAQRDEARAALVALQAERDAAIDVAASATRRADAAELGLDHALTAGEQGLVAQLDAARAAVATLTQALAEAQARIDVLTARAEKGGASRVLHEQAAEQCIREDERREDQAYRGSAVTGVVREDGVWCDAWISDDGVYRYTLTRGFNGRPPTAPLVFCMLNPSTADHREDDATIVRCCGFARRERRDGILVVYLFALRSTVPVKLTLVADPVGPHNDSAITAAACSAAPLVVAWGANARRWPTRVQRVVGLVGRNLLCLGTTKAGHPKHPLYLMALTPLMDWSPA